MLDERDKFLSRLASYLEIRVTEQQDGTVNIVSASGNTLLAGDRVNLSFDPRGDITAKSLYDTDPAKRGVGTVQLNASNGYSIDLIQHGILNSGRIGALIDLRDNILTQAQGQLDELAHGMALALSDKQVASEAVTAGAASGFDIDIAGLKSGNAISLSYIEGGTAKSVTIIRVDDASALPLADGLTPDPNDQVIGIDFSGGVAAAAALIDTALGSGVAVSEVGGKLRILDDGAGGTSDISSLSARITSSVLQNDGLQLALFTDGGSAPGIYSASLDGGDQKLGFAGSPMPLSGDVL